VKNTQKITSAMKMVAAARLRRAEERANNARPFVDRLQHFLDGFMTDPENVPHELARVRDVSRIGLLMMTSDRGLCGGFNSNLFKEAKKFLDEHGTDKVDVYMVGKKGRDHYKARNDIKIVETYLDMDQNIEHREVKAITDRVSRDFINGEIDELYLLYAKFKSPAVCIPTIIKLLPITTQEKTEDADRHIADIIFMPSPEAILNILFPKYLYTRVMVSLAETFASEQGQRMVAMTNATDNAKEMVRVLTLTFNKVRQAAITREIAEIVGGAEALG
jgi:F-type H+-transporting ATPase subunit gamma